MLAALGAFDTASAFRLARWSGLGLIVVYAFTASRLSGKRPHVALVHALAVGVGWGADLVEGVVALGGGLRGVGGDIVVIVDEPMVSSHLRGATRPLVPGFLIDA